MRIATLMSVYAGDSAEHFRLAAYSVMHQILDGGIEARLYLGVDGPLPAELESIVEELLPRLHLVSRSSTNQGLAATLNRLIDYLADESFVFRMDADDIAAATRYQTQINHLTTHTEIDILGTDIVEFDAVSGQRRQISFCHGPHDALARLHKRVPVAHPTVCFRRRVLDCMRYPLTGTNEDLSLWFACAVAGFQFDNVHEPLLEFRITENFWRRRSLRKAVSELACYSRGISSLHGWCNWRQAYPATRFLLRIAPLPISKWAYGSAYRS